MGLCAHCGTEFDGPRHRAFCCPAHKNAWHRASARHRRKLAELAAGRCCANPECGLSLDGRAPNVRHCDARCRDRARRARERQQQAPDGDRT